VRRGAADDVGGLLADLTNERWVSQQPGEALRPLGQYLELVAASQGHHGPDAGLRGAVDAGVGEVAHGVDEDRARSTPAQRFGHRGVVHGHAESRPGRAGVAIDLVLR
jgi:hypothetical protein